MKTQATSLRPGCGFTALIASVALWTLAWFAFGAGCQYWRASAVKTEVRP